MRVLFAAAVIVFGLADVGMAVAADLVGYRSGYTSQGQRAGLVWIYDYEPGIVVRAYWATPWRHRHYYPTTGEKPEFGRHEDLTGGTGGAPEPAETFQRFWSTTTVLLPELPRELDEPIQDAPFQNQNPQNQNQPNPRPLK